MIKFRINRQRTDVKRSMQKQIVWLFASEVHGRKVLLKGDVGGLLLHVDSLSVRANYHTLVHSWIIQLYKYWFWLWWSVDHWFKWLMYSKLHPYGKNFHTAAKWLKLKAKNQFGHNIVYKCGWKRWNDHFGPKYYPYRNKYNKLWVMGMSVLQ